MSATVLLEGILKKAKNEFPGNLPEDKLFEFYCVDNILVNYDLDSHEIESGIMDGARDAGIDGDVCS